LTYSVKAPGSVCGEAENHAGSDDAGDRNVRRGRIVVAVGHQRFDHPQAAERAQLEADIAGGVRLIVGAGAHGHQAAVEQQLADVEEIAAGHFGEMNVGLGFAVEELAVDIEPGCDIRSKQHLAVDTVAANAVGLLQAAQAEGLAKNGNRVVARQEGGVGGLVVILISSASFFQGEMEAGVFDAHAAAIILGAVGEQGGNRVFIVRVLHPGLDAAAGARIVVKRQVGDEVRSGEQVQPGTQRAAVDVERLLVDAARRAGIGERRHGVEVRDIAVIEIEIVKSLLARVDVSRAVGLASPTVGANVELVKKALAGIG
jgi:hypothetical protein